MNDNKNATPPAETEESKGRDPTVLAVVMFVLPLVSLIVLKLTHWI